MPATVAYAPGTKITFNLSVAGSVQLGTDGKWDWIQGDSASSQDPLERVAREAAIHGVLRELNVDAEAALDLLPDAAVDRKEYVHLSSSDKRHIRQLVRAGWTYTKIAPMFHTSISTISRLVTADRKHSKRSRTSVASR